MGAPILTLRREYLRQTQNRDGGWGYFAGKQSWMEPTFYAALALHGDPESAPALDRAWRLVKSWQTNDGGWLPAGHVEGATWVTALGVTLSVVQDEFGRAFENGVGWLLRSSGAENAWLNRLVYRLSGKGIGRDTSNRGWPWRPETTAWVEPTVHSLVALRKASTRYHAAELTERIREGEDLLLTVRGSDGGWNYGSARALGVELPSYPETTALAWIGLQDRVPPDAHLPAGRTESRLADAWLGIARTLHGQPATIEIPEQPAADLMIVALEALAAPGGNARLLRAGGPW